MLLKLWTTFTKKMKNIKNGFEKKANATVLFLNLGTTGCCYRLLTDIQGLCGG